MRKFLESNVENYKEIAKEHRRENGQKVGQLPKTKKQLDHTRKIGAKWRKEHPEEQAELGRKAGQLPKTEKQNEASRKNIEAAVKANPSKPEILFSLLLANKNIEGIHQFRIFYKDINNEKRYWWVDFFIFPNIIVQLDGVYWHCQKEKGTLLKDWLQNQELKKQGFKVIRFWDFEVNNDIEKCMIKLNKVIRNNLTYPFC